MYYDPMISKLITWGKDRKEALSLLADAMEQYVIRGVTHNVGFGLSILRNPDFARGEYTTAFIPTYYQDGFRGDPLNTDDNNQIAIAAQYMRGLYDGFSTNKNESKVRYVTLKGDKDIDFKVETKENGAF